MSENKTIRIAIIDDARLVLNGWEQAFAARADMELLFTAANKGRFMELCEKHQQELDLLIMDKSVDGKTQFNDFQYIEETRKRYPFLKIIVYTWDYYTGHIEYLKNMGINAYLPGTSDEQEMMAAIHRVMRGELYFPMNENTLKADREKYFGAGHSFDLETIRQTGDLKPAETEVAKLLAHGLLQRQIAERLHVSVKTVEKHVTKIYFKLGITHGESNTRLIFEHKYAAYFRQKFPNALDD